MQLDFRGYLLSYFSILEVIPPLMRQSITRIPHIRSPIVTFIGY